MLVLLHWTDCLLDDRVQVFQQESQSKTKLRNPFRLLRHFSSQSLLVFWFWFGLVAFILPIWSRLILFWGLLLFELIVITFDYFSYCEWTILYVNFLPFLLHISNLTWLYCKSSIASLLTHLFGTRCTVMSMTTGKNMSKRIMQSLKTNCENKHLTVNFFSFIILFIQSCRTWSRP